MARLGLVAAAAALAAAAVRGASPWDPSVWTKASQIAASMTLQQQVALCAGTGATYPYVGNNPGVPGIVDPGHLEDGPQGVADQAMNVTAWPSSLTAVMSWDPELLYAYGQALGAEQAAKGTNIMLGPGVNLARVPWGGRNFEYMGEDPVLAAALVAAEVRGIQSNGISACVKHYVFNNQEYNRDTVSANVPQKVAKEAYYVPFHAAVDAGVGTAMCSYNRVNGTYACENPTTIGELKQVGGFQGYLMSDWGATHSTVAAATAGLDQQMPDAAYFGSALLAAVQNGSVPASVVAEKATRVIAAFIATGVAAPGATWRNGSITTPVTTGEHAAMSRYFAEQTAVLLKNDGGLLPLNPAAITSIAVLGDETAAHGWGSGGVYPPYISTPSAAIYEYLNGAPAPVKTAPCTVQAGMTFNTTQSLCVDLPSQAACEAICAGEASCDGYSYQQGRQCNGWGTGGGSCFFAAAPLTATAAKGFVAATCPAAPAPPSPPRVAVTAYAGYDLSKAASIAASVDVVVLNIADVCSEGTDRPNGLNLPPWQNALVSAVVAANPKTVILARCPGACIMPWADSVPAILYQLAPGQEMGNAAARLLFGDVTPSGKLPISFPTAMNATWLGNVPNNQWPGTDRGQGFLEADYSEGLFFGYRWFQAQNIKPTFAFGHGLSYTSFNYSALAVTGPVSATAGATVYATVCNTGSRPGAEVAQLYVGGYPAAAEQPPALLKGFAKKMLVPGQCAGVAFPLSAADLQVWDVTSQSWQLLPGTYTLSVGSASDDIRLTGSLTVTA